MLRISITEQQATCGRQEVSIAVCPSCNEQVEAKSLIFTFLTIIVVLFCHPFLVQNVFSLTLYLLYLFESLHLSIMGQA